MILWNFSLSYRFSSDRLSDDFVMDFWVFPSWVNGYHSAYNAVGGNDTNL